MNSWQKLDEIREGQIVEVIPIPPSSSKHAGKKGKVIKKGIRRVSVTFFDGSKGLVDYTFLKKVSGNDEIIAEIKAKMLEINDLLSQLQIKYMYFQQQISSINVMMTDTFLLLSIFCVFSFFVEKYRQTSS